jgi:hypothetical protein
MSDQEYGDYLFNHATTINGNPIYDLVTTGKLSRFKTWRNKRRAYKKGE